MNGHAEGNPKRRSWTIFVALTVIWVLYTIAIGALYSRVPPNPDQQIFDYIGWVRSQGGDLYVDVTEHNFPGKMWIHALSTWMFGNHSWSYRAFDYLLMLAVLPMFFFTLLPVVGGWRALLVVPLYQTMYVTAGGWMAGQRDAVAAPWLLCAGLAYHARSRGGGAAWMALFAFPLLFASLTRPTYLLFAPTLVLLDLLTAHRRKRPLSRVFSDAVVAAGFCLLGIAGLAMAFWANGNLAAWLESAIYFNIEAYSQSASFGDATAMFATLSRSWHWYLAFGAAGAWMWWRGGDRDLWIVTSAVGLAVILSGYTQLKGFPYHLAGLLTPLALFAAYFLVRCFDMARLSPNAARLALAATVALVAVIGLQKKVSRAFGPEIDWHLGRTTLREMLAVHNSGVHGATYADLVDAADHIRRTVEPEQRVLVWNRAVHLNFLSERRSPTRFITHGMLVSARPPFRGTEAWTREMEEAFANHPPSVIVLHGPDQRPAEGLWDDPDPSGPTRILLRELDARYSRETAFGNLELYRLRTGG